MDHRCSSAIVADAPFDDAPFTDERSRLPQSLRSICGDARSPKVKRNELLGIAQHLRPDADRGVGMNQLLPIAQERQSLHGAATTAGRVIDIGRRWLRFLG
jgi:integrase/recombinase XerD